MAPWRLRDERRIARASAGVTLLELLIVLVIIGLLAGLVGPRLLERLDSSKVTTTETQIRELRTALDTLRLDIGRYPTTDEGLTLLMNAPTDPELRARWRGPYLEDALPNDAWGHPFNYSYSGTGNPPYSLYSYGADGKPSADGTTNKEIGILPKG
jgi:general secretion pathway protein G